MQHPYIAGDIDGYLINSNTDVQNVQVEDGQNVEADFNIQPDPTPIIAGIVLGPDGKPVAGATVTTVPNGMNEIYGTKWVQSDNQGRFHIRAESGTMLRARGKIRNDHAGARPGEGGARRTALAAQIHVHAYGVPGR